MDEARSHSGLVPAPVTRPARLDVQQERDLVIAAEAGDVDACHTLVETFLPEINAVARRFDRSMGVERRDLVQEGVAGLLFAARRYDPQLEIPFWAYASFWVRKAMQELVADLSRAVALSDRAVRGLALVRAARGEWHQSHGRDPTLAELADVTGLSREQLEPLLTADRPARSLEAPIRPDDESVDRVGARIPDPAAEEAFDVVLDDIELRHVQTLAQSLSDREQLVIRAHYGLGGPAQTLAQVGSALGLTAERARQIEAGALRKLRNLLTESAFGREAS
ncbi:MAG: sigma-70 family RNA polymerase sigma factor [Propionibacteriaceae bacterium]